MEQKTIFRLIILVLVVIFGVGIFFSIKFLKNQIDLATNPTTSAKQTTQGSLNAGYEKILPRFK